MTAGKVAPLVAPGGADVLVPHEIREPFPDVAPLAGGMHRHGPRATGGTVLAGRRAPPGIAPGGWVAVPLRPGGTLG
ncbi:hypothetical protein L1857_16810 [Amycolatopsis thermalba]|uniref:Uncharacterized protein n=1 Tax=Amycolatopsis thermalba TaxID=944492 RepID=A0ABY4NWC5_9PSEU|nr:MULTISPECIES: hypothetical protein [Amycolatopsis]UQS24369.1 hypothetical protein L1857_16810 [Amycolatopsis thermalba]